MKISDIFENKLKFRPDYKCSDQEKERECPRFYHLLDLADDRPTFLVSHGGVTDVSGNLMRETSQV